eukprot:Nk52_evm21s224 gene=Nk52_evmTU21s224
MDSSTNTEKGNGGGAEDKKHLEPTQTKRKRRSSKKCAVACVPCKACKTACDVERPCKRCIRLKIESQCIDVEHKKQKYPSKKKTTPKASIGVASVASSSAGSLAGEEPFQWECLFDVAAKPDFLPNEDRGTGLNTRKHVKGKRNPNLPGLSSHSLGGSPAKAAPPAGFPGLESLVVPSIQSVLNSRTPEQQQNDMGFFGNLVSGLRNATNEPAASLPKNDLYDHAYRVTPKQYFDNVYEELKRWKLRLLSTGLTDPQLMSCYFIYLRYYIEQSQRFNYLTPEKLLKRKNELLEGIPQTAAEIYFTDDPGDPTPDAELGDSVTRLVYEKLPIGVVKVSNANFTIRVLYANKAAAELFLLDREDVVKPPACDEIIFRIFPLEGWHVFAQEITKVIARRSERFQHTGLMVRSDGSTFKGVLSVSITYSAIGFPRHATVFVQEAKAPAVPDP